MFQFCHKAYSLFIFVITTFLSRENTLVVGIMAANKMKSTPYSQFLLQGVPS